MWDIIKQLVEHGSTILLTTQYLEEADQLADSIAVIDGGKVIAEGTADELKDMVGKERIELSFATAEDLAAAITAIGEEVQQSARESRFSIANDAGTKKLKEILQKIEDAGITVEGLSLHKPTLDDVFLKLTGHDTSEETSDDTTSADKKETK